MDTNNIARAFIQFGTVCKNLSETQQDPLFTKAAIENPWFTATEIKRAFRALSDMLSEDQVNHFSTLYIPVKQHREKKIGLIAAGNIPLVCFHDVFCVLMAGHQVHLKMSSQDTVLTEFMIRFLCKEAPELAQKIEIPDTLKNVDALIATGSDNTAMHLSYYFRHIPNLIRKNRTSIAIIHGSETEEDYKKLAEDVFAYYGLGCRNVTKLFVPMSWEVSSFYDPIYNYHYVMDHTKYHNNYTYHKAIFLLNQTEFFENHFIMLMPSSELFAPTSVLYYEKYKDIEDLNQKKALIADRIQCVIGNGNIPFGKAQYPNLTDFADGVNTMHFLLKL